MIGIRLGGRKKNTMVTKITEARGTTLVNASGSYINWRQTSSILIVVVVVVVMDGRHLLIREDA